jgi:hypothetical protein
MRRFRATCLCLQQVARYEAAKSIVVAGTKNLSFPYLWWLAKNPRRRRTTSFWNYRQTLEQKRL